MFIFALSKLVYQMLIPLITRCIFI